MLVESKYMSLDEFNLDIAILGRISNINILEKSKNTQENMIYSKLDKYIANEYNTYTNKSTFLTIEPLEVLNKINSINNKKEIEQEEYDEEDESEEEYDESEEEYEDDEFEEELEEEDSNFEEELEEEYNEEDDKSIEEEEEDTIEDEEYTNKEENNEDSNEKYKENFKNGIKNKEINNNVDNITRVMDETINRRGNSTVLVNENNELSSTFKVSSTPKDISNYIRTLAKKRCEINDLIRIFNRKDIELALKIGAISKVSKDGKIIIYI